MIDQLTVAKAINQVIVKMTKDKLLKTKDKSQF